MDRQLRIICFTRQGCRIAKKIAARIPADMYYKFQPLPDESEAMVSGMYEVKEPLNDWTEKAFNDEAALLFIGAAGIAVRAVAGAIKDKLTDIPVLVVDLDGRFVIPVLSGHYGGANELAQRISSVLGAVPVITTGTDITGGFAADVFAGKNDMKILNPAALPRISGKAVAGRRISVSSELPMRIMFEGRRPATVDYNETAHPEGTFDSDICITGRAFERDIIDESETLYLIPRFLHIGIGCRQNTDPDMLEEFATRCINQLGLSPACIASISSIDLKEKEMAVILLAEKLERPFMTYTSEELAETEGLFPESAFVRETVGVGNVSARAAARSAGKGYRLLRETVKEEGMTFAAAIPGMLMFNW